MKKKIKIICFTFGGIFLFFVLIILVFVSYIFFSYNRIGDCALQINSHSNDEKITIGQTYSCLTYNIGFGAYSQDYTFFLDEGYDNDGNKTCGHYSKAKNKDEVIFNTKGVINTVSSLNPDFIFFQEVDTNSTRSYHINQNLMILDAFSLYDSIHAINFHSAFLPYPLYDMHGKSNAGITTLSKYKIQDAYRKEYTVSTSFSKFFDLDRCFSYCKVATSNGKYLYIVNSHMSAYDEGGIIRASQLEELNSFLAECKKNNDYVIVGGDFNHDLLTNNPAYSYDSIHRSFEMTKKSPDWLSFFFDDEKKSPLISGFSVIASDNYPTCRNNDIEWNPKETFVCCIDGFVISDNIEITNHYNIQTKGGKKELDGFAFSDHDPAYIEFKLV